MTLEDEVRKIAGDDQSAAGFATVASSFAAFLKRLQDDGVAADEALDLTRAAVSAFFTETFRKMA